MMVAEGNRMRQVETKRLKKRIERRYVLTRFDARRRMSWDIDRQLRDRFGPDVCQARIAESVSVAESPCHNRSVFGHAPDSRGAQDYTALLDELQACNFLQ